MVDLIGTIITLLVYLLDPEEYGRLKDILNTYTFQELEDFERKMNE